MKISLKQLEAYQGEPRYFDEKLCIEDSLKLRDPEIISVSPASLKGFFLYEGHSVIAQFTCTLDITLPSSRSLEPVVISLEIPIVERYVPETSSSFDDDDFSEIIIPLKDDWIDLQPAVEDHILLNLPLKVLSPEELENDQMPSGKDWEVVSEEQYRSQKQRHKEQSVDPRLAGLKSFFEKDETEE